MDYESQYESQEEEGEYGQSDPSFPGGAMGAEGGYAGADEEREDPWQSLRKATEVRCPAWRHRVAHFQAPQPPYFILHFFRVFLFLWVILFFFVLGGETVDGELFRRRGRGGRRGAEEGQPMRLAR